MTENIDQVATPDEGIVTDAIPTEENADLVQEPETALDDDASPEGDVEPGEEDDTVQDAVVEDSEVEADGDQPATS